MKVVNIFRLQSIQNALVLTLVLLSSPVLCCRARRPLHANMFFLAGEGMLTCLRVRAHRTATAAAPAVQSELSSSSPSSVLKLSTAAAAVLATVLRSSPASKAAGSLALGHLDAFRPGDAGMYFLWRMCNFSIRVPCTPKYYCHVSRGVKSSKFKCLLAKGELTIWLVKSGSVCLNNESIGTCDFVFLYE